LQLALDNHETIAFSLSYSTASDLSLQCCNTVVQNWHTEYKEVTTLVGWVLFPYKL